jgi:Uma2 family endonuclease
MPMLAAVEKPPHKSRKVTMNVALRQVMTVEQFLDWEERQPLRYEFDGLKPIAMTGGNAAHAAIQRNLIIALGTRLRGKPCQPYGSDLKMMVAGPPRSTVVSDPVIVFEVLSESTASEDLVVKNAAYRATPSIQRYTNGHKE